MPFSDAKLVSELADSRPSFASPRKREAARVWEIDGRTSQSVNISQSTVDRLARERLKAAIGQKVGYNRLGEMGQTQVVGQIISTRV